MMETPEVKTPPHQVLLQGLLPGMRNLLFTDRSRM